MAQRHDLAIDAGSTFTFRLTWWTDAERTSAVDLTGYTARMQVRAASDVSPSPPGTPLVDLTSGAGITLGGVAGTIVVVIPAATTAALTPADELAEAYRYDLEVVNGSVVTRLVEGFVSVSPEVTR